MSALYAQVRGRFEAARAIAGLAPDDRAGRLHGHGFTVRLRTPIGPRGDIERERDWLVQRLLPLDYSHLNDSLDDVSDTGIARWLQAQCPGDLVGVASTPGQGVDIDETGVAMTWRRFRIEAAHQLPNVPDGHPCGRMHGHGFTITVHAREEDSEVIEQRWAPLHLVLDHACLNDLPGLDNPTSERLAAWLWDLLAPGWPRLRWITVQETATAGCHYDGREFRIWKSRTFEAALTWADAPEDDSRRLVHGHSYRVALHLAGPLDDVLAWTFDYGDVKRCFEPAYRLLDHHRLDTDVPGLVDARPATLAAWIAEQVRESVPPLVRVDVDQTPDCGVLLNLGALPPALPE